MNFILKLLSTVGSIVQIKKEIKDEKPPLKIKVKNKNERKIVFIIIAGILLHIVISNYISLNKTGAAYVDPFMKELLYKILDMISE